MMKMLLTSAILLCVGVGWGWGGFFDKVCEPQVLLKKWSWKLLLSWILSSLCTGSFPPWWGWAPGTSSLSCPMNRSSCWSIQTPPSTTWGSASSTDQWVENGRRLPVYCLSVPLRAPYIVHGLFFQIPSWGSILWFIKMFYSYMYPCRWLKKDYTMFMKITWQGIWWKNDSSIPNEFIWYTSDIF